MAMFNATCETDEMLHHDAVTTELPTPCVVKYLVKNVAVCCECLVGHSHVNEFGKRISEKFGVYKSETFLGFAAIDRMKR
jgi:hypothetical protein